MLSSIVHIAAAFLLINIIVILAPPLSPTALQLPLPPLSTMKRSHSIFNANDIDAAQKLNEGFSHDVWREKLDQSRLATRKCSVTFCCNDIASDAAGPAVWSTGLDINDPDYIAKISFTKPSATPSNQVGDILEGKVKFWNHEKGYGFITAQNGSSSTDYWFNRSCIREGNGGACMSKAEVTFTVAETPNGLKALDVVHTSCPYFMNGLGSCQHIYDGGCMYSHRIDERFVEEHQRLAAERKAVRLEEQKNHWFNVAMSEPVDLDIDCIDGLDSKGDIGGRPEEEATTQSHGPRFMHYPFEPYTMGADEGLTKSRGLQSNNKSGVTGILYDEKKNRFRVSLTFDGVTSWGHASCNHLGENDTDAFNAAIEIRLEMERERDALLEE